MTSSALTQQTLAPPVPGQGALEWWAGWAERVRADMARCSMDVKTTRLVLPQPQYLPLLRRAWGGSGLGAGQLWLPRIETLQSLQQSLAPPISPPSGGVSFDRARDQLQARQLLLAMDGVKRWARLDPSAFDAAITRVVDAAYEFATRLNSLAPAQREAWTQGVRLSLGAGSEAGRLESLLASLALEWAASPAPLASDALFDLAPGDWVFLHIGLCQALALQLAQAARERGAQVLEYGLATERVGDAGGLGASDGALLRHATEATAPTPALIVCSDFEDEAQQAAAQVIQCLQDGVQPVALVAQDRALVRRTRALLERVGVALIDETGWTLSTTRAAAAVLGVLRAAQPQASTDEVLEVLKSTDIQAAWALPDLAVDELESAWRQLAWSQAWIEPEPAVWARTASELALRLWPKVQASFMPLRELGTLPLAQAVARWGEVLEGCGIRQRWRGDAAGQQVLRVLCLVDEQAPGALSTWASKLRVDAQQLRWWAEAALDGAVYIPQMGDQAAAEVHVTPMQQVALREFAALVWPGVDEQHLGWPTAGNGLLSPQLRESLGLPTLAQQCIAQAHYFALALHTPQVVLLRRQYDGDRPLGPSALVQRLELRLKLQQLSWAPSRPARIAQQLSPNLRLAPQPRLAPFAELWPSQLSASAYEDLRACPYRYYAKYILGLRQLDELDEEIEAKDVGLWVHALLHEFHRGRPATPRVEDDVARLRECALVQAERLGLSADAALPHRLWLDALAPSYVQWLHAQEAQGRRFLDGEFSLQAQPSELADLGLSLRGRIDRVDSVPAGAPSAPSAYALLDYKTSSGQSLRSKLAKPSEETQLAFYTLLYGLGRNQDVALAEQHIEAAYLALPSRPLEPLEALSLPQAPAHAQALLAGIVADFQQLRAGQPMLALGQEQACEYCAMRGVCRRDDWS